MLIKISSNIYNKNHNEQKDYRKYKRVTQTDKFTFVDISICHLVEAELLVFREAFRLEVVCFIEVNKL
jgi:hypothetical protein